MEDPTRGPPAAPDRPGSGQGRLGRQIHPEGSEDGQVEKAGGRHDGRVLAFSEGRPG